MYITVGPHTGSYRLARCGNASLVDSVSVESNTVVERHAGQVAGHVEQLMRDLNLIVAFLLGRTNS